ncbi:hypothetical protein MVEN_00112900 [Mycena venus]|uniref:Uncharacterized protein n=1 Tax=Mycena venus TaxID=2733690 RepID=A0A8H6Z4P4_9AGAR|nr:hypothetical protein MVEN_00112900 [Mycena venus]
MGILVVFFVDNALQHFVDPSVPLLESTKVMDARFEIFNRICVRAKFTFTYPISVASSSASSSPVPGSPVRVTGSKRPKGHPDAPTPNPSPQKHRIFKKRSNQNPPPPQPTFTPRFSASTTSTTADVFGPVTRATKRGHNGVDSEDASGEEWAGCVEHDDEYSWGPEDDAPLPPESQMTTADVESVPDNSVEGNSDDDSEMNTATDDTARASDDDGLNESAGTCLAATPLDAEFCTRILRPGRKSTTTSPRFAGLGSS